MYQKTVSRERVYSEKELARIEGFLRVGIMAYENDSAFRLAVKRFIEATV